MIHIRIHSLHASAATVTVVFHRLQSNEQEVVHLLQTHGFHVSPLRASPEVQGQFTMDVSRANGGIVTAKEIETLLTPPHGAG